MLLATQRFVAANAAITEGIPAFAAAFASFDQSLETISTASLAQAQPLEATLARRDAANADAIEACVHAAAVVGGHAKRAGLPDLALQVRVTAAEFTRMRLAEQVRTCQMIHEVVQRVQPQLADVGFTAAELASLKAKVDAAVELLPSARLRVAEKRAATAELKRGLDAAVAILEHEIDPLLFPLRRTHPEFHKNYQAVREIVDTPGSRATVPVASAPGTAIASGSPDATPPAGKEAGQHAA